MCSSENPRITLTCSHLVSIADHRALTRRQKRKRTVSQDDAHDPNKMLASMKFQHATEVNKENFEAEQARLQEKIRVKATPLQTTTQDHARDIGKMLASLRTKHKDELKKALDTQDFQAAHEMKEKFTREEALLQEYDAEIKKLVEAKNDEGAAAKRKELMSKMSTAQHDAEFEIRKAKYDMELQEALQRQDFRTAAVLQQEFDSMMSAAPVPSSQAPVCGTTMLAMEKHRKHQGIPLRLSLHNAHPLDARITFSEDDHIYTLDQLIQFPLSVSGVWAQFFMPMDMHGTAVKYFHKWAVDHTSKYFDTIYCNRMMGKSDEDIIDIIVSTWEELGRSTSQQGTYMHRQIELYLNGAEADESIPEMQQFKRFLEDVAIPNMWIPFRTEWSIFDERHMVAGQIDCIFKHAERPEYHMVDWKRCGKPLEPYANAVFEKYGFHPCDFLIDNPWSHYAAQQNIYAAILERNYGIVLKSMHLVQLHKDQDSYRFIPIPAFLDVAQEMLQITQPVGWHTVGSRGVHVECSL